MNKIAIVFFIFINAMPEWFHTQPKCSLYRMDSDLVQEALLSFPRESEP